jgi:hypothetical protein
MLVLAQDADDPSIVGLARCVVNPALMPGVEIVDP